MNIRKAVVEKVLSELNGLLSKDYFELRRNRYEINKLADRQRVIKKSINIRFDLIRKLKGKNENNNR